MILELESILREQGDMDIAITSLNCKTKGFPMASSFICMGTDGEGTLYIAGKYCRACEECAY